MLAMLARQQDGHQTDNGDWEAVLREALGEAAVADFRAFLGGRMPLPASDAFGPCFRRVAKPLRRYELGFDTAVLAEPKRIVRGLVAGSAAAAAAGLRDGDEIVVPVPQDGIQGNQTELLKLTVRRDGRTFPLQYLPRGETVQAWQWERVPGVADAGCALVSRLLLPLLLLATPAAAETERLSIVANGEVVGSVVGTTTGNRVTVDYRVDDNGRGPKHREEITLGGRRHADRMDDRRHVADGRPGQRTLSLGERPCALDQSGGQRRGGERRARPVYRQRRQPLGRRRLCARRAGQGRAASRPCRAGG
ncbi:MAG: hypothetical protein PGN08_05985 [Sphingomonas taxi]